MKEIIEVLTDNFRNRNCGQCASKRSIRKNWNRLSAKFSLLLLVRHTGHRSRGRHRVSGRDGDSAEADRLGVPNRRMMTKYGLMAAYL